MGWCNLEEMHAALIVSLPESKCSLVLRLPSPLHPIDGTVQSGKNAREAGNQLVS